MSGLKRNIPVPESMPLGYQILLQKEKMVKPASVKFFEMRLYKHRPGKIILLNMTEYKAYYQVMLIDLQDQVEDMKNIS